MHSCSPAASSQHLALIPGCLLTLLTQPSRPSRHPCSYERSSQFVGRALRMPENANLVSAAC